MKISYLVFITLAWFCWIGSACQALDDSGRTRKAGQNSDQNKTTREGDARVIKERLDRNSQPICDKNNKSQNNENCRKVEGSNQIKKSIKGFFKGFGKLFFGNCDGGSVSGTHLSSLSGLLLSFTPLGNGIGCVQGAVEEISDKLCTAITQAETNIEKADNDIDKERAENELSDLKETEDSFRKELGDLAEEVETNPKYGNRASEKALGSLAKGIKGALEDESRLYCS